MANINKDDLIVKAIELGILAPDVKKEDVDYQDTLKKVTEVKNADKPSGDDPKTGEVIEEKTLSKKEKAEAEKQIIKNRKQRTIEALKKQPKMTIIIPREPKEPKDAFETVMINGYIMQIQKGVYVEVPEQVGKIIMDSQQQTTDAVTEAKEKLKNTEKMEFDNSN